MTLFIDYILTTRFHGLLMLVWTDQNTIQYNTLIGPSKFAAGKWVKMFSVFSRSSVGVDASFAFFLYGHGIITGNVITDTFDTTSQQRKGMMV